MVEILVLCMQLSVSLSIPIDRDLLEVDRSGGPGLQQRQKLTSCDALVREWADGRGRMSLGALLRWSRAGTPRVTHPDLIVTKPILAAGGAVVNLNRGYADCPVEINGHPDVASMGKATVGKQIVEAL